MYWKNNMVMYNIEKKIVKDIKTMKNKYKILNDEDYVKKFAKYGLDKCLIMSLKNAVLLDELISNFWVYKNAVAEMSEEYVKHNILYISEKYKASPIILMKVMFESRGYSKKEIRKIFDGKYDNITEYDKKQIIMARENDDFGDMDNDDVLRRSMMFEIKVGEMLKENGIRYKTQEDLCKEQMKKDGYVSCTPDFLLLDGLDVDGVNIKWIDCKNYYGAYTKKIVKGIKKQTKKYLDRYGGGCIVFNYGYSEKLCFENIILKNM